MNVSTRQDIIYSAQNVGVISIRKPDVKTMHGPIGEQSTSHVHTHLYDSLMACDNAIAAKIAKSRCGR
jgi:hypothetical protein